MHKYDLQKMKRAKARQTKFRTFCGYCIVTIILIGSTLGVAYASDISRGVNPCTGELTEPVYLICDVIESYDSDDTTTLIVELPNGELHEYEIIDAPEGEIYEVCLLCPNGNDAPPTEYEVVALR